MDKRSEPSDTLRIIFPGPGQQQSLKKYVHILKQIRECQRNEFLKMLTTAEGIM